MENKDPTSELRNLAFENYLLSQENKKQKEEIQHFTSHVAQLTSKSQLDNDRELSKEIVRLNNIIKSKNEEIKNLQLKNGSNVEMLNLLSAYTEISKRLNQEKFALQQKVDEYEKLVTKLSGENELLRKQSFNNADKYEKLITKLSGENELLRKQSSNVEQQLKLKEEFFNSKTKILESATKRYQGEIKELQAQLKQNLAIIDPSYAVQENNNKTINYINYGENKAYNNNRLDQASVSKPSYKNALLYGDQSNVISPSSNVNNATTNSNNAQRKK